ncbi:hypothetical protein MalM25_14480 [Planctomycetes bacterium MalM25]|nr:hypothetical protein MalM25_14480 [Planctomycetes bacterium MalM25]
MTSPTDPPDDSPAENGSLDLAVIQALARITGGDIAAFSEATDPPEEVVRWLGKADRAQVNGLLIQTLRRWNQLRRS